MKQGCGKAKAKALYYPPSGQLSLTSVCGLCLPGMTRWWGRKWRGSRSINTCPADVHCDLPWRQLRRSSQQQAPLTGKKLPFQSRSRLACRHKGDGAFKDKGQLELLLLLFYPKIIEFWSVLFNIGNGPKNTIPLVSIYLELNERAQGGRFAEPKSRKIISN